MRKKIKTTRGSYKSLVVRIASATGLFERQVRQVVLHLARYTIEDLIDGQKVHLKGLGRFWLKKARAQVCYDPYRKIKKPVSERFIPKFSYGKHANEIIRDQTAERAINTRTDRKER